MRTQPVVSIAVAILIGVSGMACKDGLPEIGADRALNDRDAFVVDRDRDAADGPDRGGPLDASGAPDLGSGDAAPDASVPRDAEANLDATLVDAADAGADTGGGTDADAPDADAPDADAAVIDAGAGNTDAGSAGADAGPVDGDAGADDAALPRCTDAGTQSQGEDCVCAGDCDPSAPRCLRNFAIEPTGTSYCTTSCAVPSDCDPGYECLTQLAGAGATPFCHRCATNQPGTLQLGDECICDADCGTTQVGNITRNLSCIDRQCTVSVCTAVGPSRCPTGWACDMTSAPSHCVQCSNPAPAPRGSSCGCPTDCQAGLTCAAGVCQQPCTSGTDCANGEECREELEGAAYCRAVPASCTGSLDVEIGGVCQCNADCDSTAPSCISLSAAGSTTAGLCTLRPCDVQSSPACPAGSGQAAYRCCRVPLLFPATCVPEVLASQIETVGTCSP